MEIPQNPLIQIEQQLLDLQESEFRFLARTDLLSFSKYIDPYYEINWHHRHLCKKLTDFAYGRIRRLMVFMPPRHGKSELVSRKLPGFIFGINPNAQIILASYAAELASLMNRDVQKIVDSPTYSELFPKTFLRKFNSRAGTWGPSAARTTELFEIVGHKGMFRSCGVGGGITGMGADYAIIDDPIKNQEEAFSHTYRNKVWHWYQSTLSTRLEKNDHILLTMTRWHDDDLAGRLLKLQDEEPDSDKWEIINFPAVKENIQNKSDPRKIGEALWPNKYSQERLKKMKMSLGSFFWSSMYQQNPIPITGGLFKRSWWKTFREPPNFSRIVQFWDCAQKVGISNDYSVCATWGQTNEGYYLLDIWRNKVEAPQLEQAIQNQYSKFKPNAVVIEDKSSGSSVIQNLRQKTLIPIIAYDPKGRDKEIRASAITPTVEAGKCFIPETVNWVEDFIIEHERFPNAEHDDQVDTTSMALEFFNKQQIIPRVRYL